MLFSRWLTRNPRRKQTFRPGVTLLEDRCVPAAAPGAATHLLVVTPPTVKAGQSFDVAVAALSASNQPSQTYTGAVTFSLGTSDLGAVLPASYQFTPSDHGVHRFQVMLQAVGSQTVTVTDRLSKTITGSSPTIVTSTPVPSTVVVKGAQQATVGVATPVTVQVNDQYGNVVPNFTGTVTFSSTDPAATVAATTGGSTTPLSTFSYTFTAADHGWHVFNFSFGTGLATGTATTLTTTVNASGKLILGNSLALTVFPSTTVTHFGVVTSSASFAGMAVPVLVQALNGANQPVSNYTGTVSFSSTDANAVVSATQGVAGALLSGFTYNFTPGDAGQHTFWLTFGTTGPQTLTTTDKLANMASTVNVLVASSQPPKKRFLFSL